jgi:hypothetical protein
MLGAEAQPQHVTLPPPPEREWLINQTADLLARGGDSACTAYLRAPMLEPTPAYFPDRWAGGEASVRRLLLRLLRYAGHPNIDVEVEIHEEDPARRGDVQNKPAPMRGKDPVAWFVRREGEVLHFACEEAILREPENLVPALARAVAHAHRVLVGVPNPDNQRLIDLTGVALGFGLLTTDACQRFYAKAAGGFRSTRAEFRLGALSVQDMSFLLALQFSARSTDKRTLRKILGGVQPNQAAFVREALAWLEQLDPPVRERLKLPPPDRWPPADALGMLTGPLEDPRRRAASPEQLISGSGVFDDALDDDEGDEDEDERAKQDDEPRRDIDRGIRMANRGKPVFRIERSGALRLAKLLGLPVMLLGFLFSRGEFGVEVKMEIVMPVALGLALVGLAVGSFFTDRRCSEPKCGSTLGVDDTHCPLCGGVVMGVLTHPEQRLGAEEDLVRAGKITSEGLVAGWEDDDVDEAG